MCPIFLCSVRPPFGTIEPVRRKPAASWSRRHIHSWIIDGFD
jgi:hypothetical protein